MTQALRLQGWVFCGVAGACVVAGLAGARLQARDELLAAGAFILLLGMPHGAFDVVVARRLFGAAGFKRWALFLLVYLGLAAAVVGFWMLAPTLFLGVFLIGSALHFGDDPARGVSRIARGLYGGAVVVLPALWHGEELQRLLRLVAGAGSAAWLAPVLHQLAVPWLVATVLTCAVQFRTAAAAACEWAGLAALSVAAPPLVAFCVYFCVMHSPRHIIKTLANMPVVEARRALWLALWPTLAVVLVAAVLFGFANHLPLDARVMQLMFVGLAALTLPHMVLIGHERRTAQRAAHAASP